MSKRRYKIAPANIPSDSFTVYAIRTKDHDPKFLADDPISTRDFFHRVVANLRFAKIFRRKAPADALCVALSSGGRQWEVVTIISKVQP